MYKVAFLSFFLLIVFGLSAQYISGVTIPDTTNPRIDDKTWQLAQSISEADLREHLFLLASDSLGGRELGTEGNLKAADYIAGQFMDMGLPPAGPKGYFQEVAFTWLYWDEISINIHGQRFKQLWDFIAFPGKNRSSEISTDKVLFLGYGIDDESYSDYDKIETEDKVILIYDKEPIDKDSNYLLTKSSNPSSWSDSLQLKLEAAADHGVRHVLIISENIKKMVNKHRNQLLGPRVILGKVDGSRKAPVDYTFISSTMAKKIIGEDIKKVIRSRKCIVKKGKAKPVEIETDIEIVQQHKSRFVDGVNVAAISEGTSDKDEYILISAHYDHIGKKGKDINNGADDNASGTSTVLEIAEAFAEARKQGLTHSRNVMFLLVTGEEKGLLGSQYYVENPLAPINESIVNINIDMVGRIHEKYKDNPEYIYVIGSDRLSTELHHVNELVNQKYARLTLDYQYNDKSDPNRFYYRSDHYNFARKGIPAIFFFNGTHEDYHRPTDTAEKIQFEKMSLVAQHIFTLAWEIATREASITVDAQP